MIRVLHYNKSSNEVVAGGEELVAAWRQNADTSLWVDISGESADVEARFLRETFGIHPLAIKDAQRIRHPPKIEAFDNYTFILLKVPDSDSAGLKFSTTQLTLFIGERFLITRSSSQLSIIDRLYEQVSSSPGLLGAGSAALALRLSRMVVDRYLKIMLSLEPRLEELEAEIMQHPEDSVLAELLSYKTELKKYRRVFLYHQQVFGELKSGAFPAIDENRTHEIIDVYEQQERTGSLASLYYEMVSDLAEGYISIASHRLNQIMKVLTVVMAIFVPLSFLAGIYGMNFENMPELHSRNGYFILLGLMLSIVTVLIVIFRKKRWL